MYCHVSPVAICGWVICRSRPALEALCYIFRKYFLGIFPYKGMSHFQGGHIKRGTSNWGTYLTCSLIKWRLCCIDDYPWWLGYINSSYLWRRTTQLLYDEIIPVHSVDYPDYPKVFCRVKRSVFIPKNSGWWFQSWLSFSIIYGIILPID